MTLGLTAKLLCTVDAYCAASGLSSSRVSTLLWGDGMRLKGIVAGKDLTVRSYERAMQWFAANWPSTTPWPEGVDRPVPDQHTGLVQNEAVHS